VLTEFVPHEFVPKVLEDKAGISNHSSPWMSSLFKKNGQSLTRRASDSFASAAEMGTCEDCTTAIATSEAGNARRFLPGVAKLPLVGAENFLERCKCDVRDYVVTPTSKHFRRPGQDDQGDIFSSFPLG